MLKIVDFKLRENSMGEEFYALIVQGEFELVQSKETGNYYATAPKASILSTFNEEYCKGLIGKDIPGKISRINCEPYEYTIQDTGEVITLEHSWVYEPDDASVSDRKQADEADGIDIKPVLEEAFS